jgi:hypothetical protein
MRKFVFLICGLALLAGAARAQSPISQLHDALHLTAAQEDAWRAYQAAVAPDPDQRARAEAAAAMAPRLPTPRRLALIRAQMQADLATFDHDAQAVTAFYTALTPDQQQAFDRQTARPRSPDR